MIGLLAAFAASAGSSIIYSLANLASSYSDTSPVTTTYSVNIVFRTAGQVDVLRSVASNLLNEEQYVTPGSESANTYVRCTYVSGDHMTSGDTENTWHQCNIERNFEMLHTSAGGVDFLSGTFDIELSNDGGTTIVASKLGVTVEAGESA